MSDNFEEDGYFGRFIDYEFSLPLLSQDNLNGFFLKNMWYLNDNTNHIYFKFYQTPFINQDISLRKGEKINKYIDIIIMICPPNILENNLSRVYLAFGMFLKFMEPNLFNSIVLKNEQPFDISRAEKQVIYKSFKFTKYTYYNSKPINDKALDMEIEEFLFALFHLENEQSDSKTSVLKMNLINSLGMIDHDYMMLNEFIENVEKKYTGYGINYYDKIYLDSIFSYYG